MKHTIVALAFALSTASAKADAVLCKDFLRLEEAAQAMFVSGLVDGMRTMHGVTNTFARHLKAATSSVEEQAGIEKLRALPQQYLSRGDSLSKLEITAKLVRGCQAKPELPVGNRLTDVMSGDL